MNKEPVNFLETLGAVALSAMRSPNYAQYPIASFPAWIEPAILLDQIHILYDPQGQVVGYVTWAFLASDAEERLMHDPEVLLHISEWNEGTRLWILDFVVRDHLVKRHIKEVCALFPVHEEAKSLRRREDGTVRKITRWRLGRLR
jgi:cytolysin-activating lysine-acyltransferase